MTTTNRLQLVNITFCIKTIHRPWSCHRLVESLREHIAADERQRIWMHRDEKKRVGTFAWRDMVSNAFLTRKETIASLRWDAALKTYEHWEFFYRARVVKKLIRAFDMPKHAISSICQPCILHELM